jgi:hypothetical protein
MICEASGGDCGDAADATAKVHAKRHANATLSARNFISNLRGCPFEPTRRVHCAGMLDVNRAMVAS